MMVCRSSRHVAFLESAFQAENEIKALFVTYSHVHNFAVCNLQKMRTVTQKFTLMSNPLDKLQPNT